MSRAKLSTIYLEVRGQDGRRCGCRLDLTLIGSSGTNLDSCLTQLLDSLKTVSVMMTPEEAASLLNDLADEPVN